MEKARRSREERVAENSLCKLLREYQDGIGQCAERLLRQHDQDKHSNCMNSLADERDRLKEIMREATGTAQGWTNATYELLTVEFLKYGLRDRIEADWELCKEKRHYVWSGMTKGKQLKILPNMKFYGMKPDVRVALGEETLAIVETKSSFEGSRAIQTWLTRLHTIVKKLGEQSPPVRPLVAIVCYGHHWKGGKVDPPLDCPDSFRFVCASHLVCLRKDNRIVASSKMLGFKRHDIPSLLRAIRRTFH